MRLPSLSVPESVNSKALDMKLDRRFHVSERFFIGVAFTDNHSLHAQRIGFRFHSLRFDIEPEITAKLLRAGIEIHEVLFPTIREQTKKERGLAG